MQTNFLYTNRVEGPTQIRRVFLIWSGKRAMKTTLTSETLVLAVQVESEDLVALGLSLYLAHIHFTALLSSTLRFNDVPHVSRTIDKAWQSQQLFVKFSFTLQAPAKLLPSKDGACDMNNFTTRTAWRDTSELQNSFEQTNDNPQKQQKLKQMNGFIS